MVSRITAELFAYSNSGHIYFVICWIMLYLRSPASPDPNNAFLKKLLLAYLPSGNEMNLNLCSTKGVPATHLSYLSLQSTDFGADKDTAAALSSAESPGAGFGQQSPEQLRLLLVSQGRDRSPQTPGPTRCDTWN